MLKIEISEMRPGLNRWAGDGTVSPTGQIEDCDAVLGDTPEETEAIYRAIEDEIDGPGEYEVEAAGRRWKVTVEEADDDEDDEDGDAREIGWFATRDEANAEIRRMIAAGKGANVMRVEERPSRPVDSAAVAAGIVPASGTPVYYVVATTLRATLEFLGWGLVGEPLDGVLVNGPNGPALDVSGGYSAEDYWDGDEFRGPDPYGVVPIYRRRDTGEQFPPKAKAYDYLA